MKLILGSTSKYKKAVLEKAGFIFDSMDPAVDEFSIRSDDPYQLPLLLAQAKARAIVSKIKEPGIIIGSDIVVVCDGQLYEKPESPEQARAWLKKYSDGYAADCPCGIHVINTATGKTADGVNVASIIFNNIPDHVIEDFIATGDPFSKAGGFSVQLPHLQPYIKEMKGDIEAMMGMPTDLLKKLIEEVSS
jgi:septum formation protein